MVATEAQEIINTYLDDLFQGIITSADPKIAAKEYVKKKRLRHKFRRLLELDNLSEEQKDELINKMIDVLPEFTTKEAYIETQRKILGILMEQLADTFKEIDELLDILSYSEIKSALKIVQRKQKHIIISLRENLAEMILNEPKEELLVLDQALSLAIRLYEIMLERPDDVSKSLFLLIIFLRILGIVKGKFDYSILYEDLAEITAELDIDGDIPRPIFELLSL